MKGVYKITLMKFINGKIIVKYMAKNLYMCSEKVTFAPGSKNLKPDKVFEDGVFIREEGTFCEFTSKLV